MITLNNIINYYYGIKVINRRHLREDVFLGRLIFEICKDLHISNGLAGKLEEFPFSGLQKSQTRLKDWNTAKKEIDKLFKSKDKVIDVSFKKYPKLVIGHYVESLYAFERSIFWFFNYKHNLDPFNQIASEQALYYSEFFSIVALTRFLGGSLSHTPLGLFKIKINWENATISIHYRFSLRSSHESYKDLFFELLDSVKFTDHNYLETVKNDPSYREIGFIMKENRIENIYNLSSRMSNPFKNVTHYELYESSLKTSRGLNFLEGPDKLYSKMANNDNDGDLAESLLEEYDHDGYRQHHIGEYWKFIIYLIKKTQDTEEYIENLTWKINRFDVCDSVKLDKNTKEILINWLSNNEIY